MVVPFGLIALGALLAYSGLKNQSLLETVRGLPGSVPSVWGAVSVYNASASTGGSSSSDSKANQGTGQQPSGVGTFDGKPVARWIITYLAWARKHGWSGTVTSGYRSTADQARVCATGVRPCAAPGHSNHQGKAFPSGAVDVTNASQLSQVLKRRPGPKLLVWAGSKDPVHFSHPHNGSY